MSSEVRYCSPQDDVTAVEALMQSAQVRRIPVCEEGGRLVGLVSLNDIARETAAEEGRPRASKGLAPADVAHTLAAICQPRALYAAP